MKIRSFFHNSLYLLIALLGNARLAGAQTESLTSDSPGTLSLYQLRNGGVFKDSVISVTRTDVYVMRTTIQGSTRIETVRHFELRTSGAVLVDDDGEQLFFPQPWPPKEEWSYSYKNAIYRYTPLGPQRVNFRSRVVDAIHVQLTVETRGSARAFDLWLTPALGIVKRYTRPNGSAQDYDLIETRQPVQPLTTVSTQPATTTSSGSFPVTRGSIKIRRDPGSNWFLDVGMGGLYSPALAALSYRDSTIVPIAVFDIGSRGNVLGFRLRYGTAIPENSEATDLLQFGQFDLTVSTPRYYRFALFLAGGIVGTNGGEQDGNTIRFLPGAGGGATIRLGQHYQLLIDGSYIKGIVQRYSTIAANNESATSGIVNVAIRYH